MSVAKRMLATGKFGRFTPTPMADWQPPAREPPPAAPPEQPQPRRPPPPARRRRRDPDQLTLFDGG